MNKYGIVNKGFVSETSAFTVLKAPGGSASKISAFTILK